MPRSTPFAAASHSPSAPAAPARSAGRTSRQNAASTCRQLAGAGAGLVRGCSTGRGEAQPALEGSTQVARQKCFLNNREVSPTQAQTGSKHAACRAASPVALVQRAAQQPRVEAVCYEGILQRPHVWQLCRRHQRLVAQRARAVGRADLRASEAGRGGGGGGGGGAATSGVSVHERRCGVHM